MTSVQATSHRVLLAHMPVKTRGRRIDLEPVGCCESEKIKYTGQYSLARHVSERIKFENLLHSRIDAQISARKDKRTSPGINAEHVADALRTSVIGTSLCDI